MRELCALIPFAQDLPGILPVLIPEEEKPFLRLPPRGKKLLGQMDLLFGRLLLADGPEVLFALHLPLVMESGFEPVEGILRRLIQRVLHGQPGIGPVLLPVGEAQIQIVDEAKEHRRGDLTADPGFYGVLILRLRLPVSVVMAVHQGKRLFSHLLAEFL